MAIFFIRVILYRVGQGFWRSGKKIAETPVKSSVAVAHIPRHGVRPTQRAPVIPPENRRPHCTALALIAQTRPIHGRVD